MNKEQDAPKKEGRDQGGAILLVVLVFVFLLSFITLRFVSEVGERLHYKVQTGGDFELAQVARDAWVHTIAVFAEIREVEGGFYSPAQGWGNPLSYAPMDEIPEGVELVVSVEDLSGKLSLASMDEETMRTLLESVGWRTSEASRLTDLFFDWVDEDDLARVQGAETRDYRNSDRPHIRPRNAMIKNMEELWLIRGFREWFTSGDPDLQASRDAFLRSVTLDNTGPANLNTANDRVLEVVARNDFLNPAAIRQFLAGRDRIPGTADDQYFDSADNPALNSMKGDGSRLGGITSGVFRVTIRATRHGMVHHVISGVFREGKGDFQLAETLAVEGESREPVASGGGVGQDASEPFEILELSENFVNAHF